MKAWTLRTSLILLLMATTLSTFLILGISILLYRLPQVAENSQEIAQREAGDIAHLLEYQLGGIQAQVQPTVAFLRASHSKAEIQSHLDAIVGDGITIEAIYVVNVDGSIEAVGLPAVRQYRRNDLSIGDFSANRIFRNALEYGTAVWSDKYLSAMTGSFAVGLAIPSDDHVVIAEISPRAILESVRAISRRTDHPALVVDSRGEWIADNSNNSDSRLQNWAGHPAVKAALSHTAPPETVTLAGKRHHPGHDVSPHLGWAFIVGVPAGMNNPDISSSVYLVVGCFFAALVIGFFITPLWVAQYERPLRQLVDRTHRLALGDFSSASAEKGRIIELNDLAQDMEQMAHAIQERQEEISRSAKRLQDSEQELLAIFNASPVAMSISDVRRNYGVVTVNLAWEKQFGRSRDRVNGLNGAQFGLWAEPSDRQVFLRQLESTGAVDDLDFWMLKNDGSRILCRTSGRLVDTADQKFLIMVQEDITERRRNEEEIRELNADLEARVLRRTNDLARANQELNDTLSHLQATQNELVNSEKLAALGRLVAGIAHELNTPIGNGLMAATTFRDQLKEFRNSLQGGLKRNVFDAFLGNAETATEITVRNLERGAQLVNSFKRVAVDQTSDQRRSFVLKETVYETLSILHPTLKRTPFKIEADIPENIELDSYPGAVEQILANLINNAIIHGFEGRDHGTIRIQAERTGKERVRIVLADDGVGIPLTMRPRIFDPFFTTKLGKGGSGLGLHITHNAVTGILGGSISFESQEDLGTRFEIVLPLVAPEHKATD